MNEIKLDSLDLAALLCSRVCHDVIGPVGAIVNGLEMLAEEKDEQMRTMTIDMVNKSANQASARLKFARVAFGAAGSAGASIDTGDAESVAKGFLSDGKTSLVWNGARQLLPKNQVKLILNLVLIAGHAIPRGGVMTLDIAGGPETLAVTLRASGINARIPPHVVELLAGHAENGVIDAHAIQPYYTGRIAAAAGMAVGVEMIDADVIFSARTLAA